MRKSHRCEEGLIYEGGVFLHVANFDQSPGGGEEASSTSL